MAQTKRVPPRYVPGQMNKTEQRYADQLEAMKYAGKILAWYFEPIKIRLAEKTYYSPDFLVIYPGYMEFVEVKGFLRDDAAVKFKTAAEKLPYLAWRMIRWKNKTVGWQTVMER